MRQGRHPRTFLYQLWKHIDKNVSIIDVFLYLVRTLHLTSDVCQLWNALYVEVFFVRIVLGGELALGLRLGYL